MEMREYALALLESGTLAGKLRAAPDGIADARPGPAVRIAAPARAEGLAIASARRVKVPPVAGMGDPAQRVRILHALANHELQAVELFAWAILAFPDAPAAFRRGLLAILGDEQRHFRLYEGRMAALGARFGDFPVTGHFWNKLGKLETPLEFVCAMGLTFENANLDFALDYARAATSAGDLETAAVLAQVHADEIRHVGFAWRWLCRLKEAEDSPWDAYVGALSWPLGPGRARGRELDRQSREQAGLDADFIDELERAAPRRPSGAPR